jgi:hypothetical protein
VLARKPKRGTPSRDGFDGLIDTAGQEKQFCAGEMKDDLIGSAALRVYGSRAHCRGAKVPSELVRSSTGIATCRLVAVRYP